MAELTLRERLAIRESIKNFSDAFGYNFNVSHQNIDGNNYLILKNYEAKNCDQTLRCENVAFQFSDIAQLKSIITSLTNNIGINQLASDSNISLTSNAESSLQIKDLAYKVSSAKNLSFMNENGKSQILKTDSEIADAVKNRESFSKVNAYTANSLFKLRQKNIELTPEQAEFLAYYKQEGYEFINSFLNEGEIKTRGNPARETINTEFVDNLLNLDKLIASTEPLEQELIVYRGTGNRHDKNNSFVSSTLSKEVVQGTKFTKGTMYRIVVPKGSHVLSVENVSGMDKYFDGINHEAEILLRPCSLITENEQVNGDITKVNATAQENPSFETLIYNALLRRKEDYLKNKNEGQIVSYNATIDYVQSILNGKLKAANASEVRS